MLLRTRVACSYAGLGTSACIVRGGLTEIACFSKTCAITGDPARDWAGEWARLLACITSIIARIGTRLITSIRTGVQARRETGSICPQRYYTTTVFGNIIIQCVPVFSGVGKAMDSSRQKIHIVAVLFHSYRIQGSTCQGTGSGKRYCK